MYSIFHTSQCGSTYLAALLSASIPTYTEPQWSHFLKNVDIDERIRVASECHKQNTLVKYSSVFCHLMPNIEGKKVFLYRNFNNHYQKHINNPDMPFHIDVISKNFHWKTDSLGDIKTELMVQFALWADRIFWAIEEYERNPDNIMFVNAEKMMENPERTARQICMFFGIEYKAVPVNFNVKSANLNHSDVPLDLSNVEIVEPFVEPYIQVDFEAVKLAHKMTEKYPKLIQFI